MKITVSNLTLASQPKFDALLLGVFQEYCEKHNAIFSWSESGKRLVAFRPKVNTVVQKGIVKGAGIKYHSPGAKLVIAATVADDQFYVTLDMSVALVDIAAPLAEFADKYHTVARPLTDLQAPGVVREVSDELIAHTLRDNEVLLKDVRKRATAIQQEAEKRISAVDEYFNPS